MLKIKNLTVATQDHELIEDINLVVNKDEVHAIIGPPKAGKTALMYAIVGLPFVDITEGTIHFKNKKINNQKMHERSLNGIASVFQDLIEVPNTTNWELFKSILKYRKDKRDLTELEALYKIRCLSLGLELDHGDIEANSDSMSYTEAIKNEVLIMSMLEPELAVIDCFDEKLQQEDKDIIAECISAFAHSESRATIIFSRNKAVLEAINPTHVHVMVDGRLVLSGGKELLQRIEEDGYSELFAS